MRNYKLNEMKTLFRLEHSGKKISSYFAEIINKEPQHSPYVKIGDDVQSFFIPDKDLERFAVNILKALKSDKLK